MEKTYKILKLLIWVLLFAVLMVGAYTLYNRLSSEVNVGGIATVAQETEAPEAAASQTEATPSMAPDFTVYDLEGNPVKLSDFYGKPILLNFWASWCGPCKMEMPEIQKFYDKYGQEIHFLLVSVDDSLDAAKTLISDSSYTFPVYFDTTSVGAYTYGASSIPLTFFIDAQGNLTAYYMGAMSESILQQGVDMIYTPETAE